MSKFEPLWERIQNDGRQTFTLTFSENREIAGIPIDHSFLRYKQELPQYGYQVGKILRKEETVIFHKIR